MIIIRDWSAGPSIADLVLHHSVCRVFWGHTTVIVLRYCNCIGHWILGIDHWASLSTSAEYRTYGLGAVAIAIAIAISILAPVPDMASALMELICEAQPQLRSNTEEYREITGLGAVRRVGPDGGGFMNHDQDQE